MSTRRHAGQGPSLPSGAPPLRRLRGERREHPDRTASAPGTAAPRCAESRAGRRVARPPEPRQDARDRARSRARRPARAELLAAHSAAPTAWRAEPMREIILLLRDPSKAIPERTWQRGVSFVEPSCVAGLRGVSQPGRVRGLHARGRGARRNRLTRTVRLHRDGRDLVGLRREEADMSFVSRGFHRRHTEPDQEGRVPPGQYVTSDFPGALGRPDAAPAAGELELLDRRGGRRAAALDAGTSSGRCRARRSRRTSTA